MRARGQLHSCRAHSQPEHQGRKLCSGTCRSFQTDSRVLQQRRVLQRRRVLRRAATRQPASLMAIGMAMAAAMMSSRISATHIHLRVFFCSRLAATRWVVPACTYSTLLATCAHTGHSRVSQRGGCQ